VKGKKPYSKGSCRKVRGNPAPFKKIKNLPDTDAAEMLFSYFENNENLLMRRYPQFELNLERKTKRGVYDPTKAVKLFMYLADEISKQYSKSRGMTLGSAYGNAKTHYADVPTRYYLATLLLKKYEDEHWPVKQNPSPSAARLRRQAEIMEMDERLVPSTMTYEDIKDDPKLIAHYKKIMTPMAWKQLVDDWIRSGVTDPARRGFVIPKESEYRRMVSGNPPSIRSDAVRRREVLPASILAVALETPAGDWFSARSYKVKNLGEAISAELDSDLPFLVSADIKLNENVIKEKNPDEFSAPYQPSRTFREGEIIHVDNETIRRGLRIVASGKAKVADSYRKLAAKLQFWPYEKNSAFYHDFPDFDAYEADIFLQAGVFGNVIFG
jgi:hypothetical protein